MVVKYAWSAAGYVLIAIPVFFPKAREMANAAASKAKEAAKARDDGLSISQRTESE